jgi:phosphatidylinositol glycan class O
LRELLHACIVLFPVHPPNHPTIFASTHPGLPVSKAIHATAETLFQGAYPGGPHDRTLLLVLSDHGQTLGGDHGGASRDEVDTLLLGFNMGAWASAQHVGVNLSSSIQRSSGVGIGDRGGDEHADTSGIRDTNNSPLENVSTRDLNSSSQGTSQSTAEVQGQLSQQTARVDVCAPSGDGPNPTATLAKQTAKVVVQQLDFAATLSVLLGLPVPYSNLGSVDDSLWLLAHPSESAAMSTTSDTMCQYGQALVAVASQVC